MAVGRPDRNRFTGEQAQSKGGKWTAVDGGSGVRMELSVCLFLFSFLLSSLLRNHVPRRSWGVGGLQVGQHAPTVCLSRLCLFRKSECYPSALVGAVPGGVCIRHPLTEGR